MAAKNIALLKKRNWIKIAEELELKGEWSTYYRDSGQEVRLDEVDAEAIYEVASKVMSWLDIELNEPEFKVMEQVVADRLKEYPD